VTILFVEDETFTRLMLISELEACGHTGHFLLLAKGDIGCVAAQAAFAGSPKTPSGII
jgi:hypothetical protein